MPSLLDRKINIRRIILAVVCSGSLIAITGLAVLYLPLLNPIKLKLLGKKTIHDVIERYGEDARNRMRPYFLEKGVSYPPSQVTLFFSKSKKKLELYAKNESGDLKLIHSYEVYGSSGRPGPKIKNGDQQVPEGIYRIEALNPNSSLHLALRLNYPNQTDREFAKVDHREDLGGDIMIHGFDVSIGCLAIGNTAIEEVFTLAAETDWQTWKVIMSPIDFRTESFEQIDRSKWRNQDRPWVPGLYEKIKAENVALRIN